MYMGNNQDYEEDKIKKGYNLHTGNSKDSRPPCVRGCSPCVRCR